jgi:hypothetical protein
VKRLGRFLIGGIVAVGVVVPVVASTASVAGATSTNLTLESPWKPAPFGTNTPSVSIKAGVVSFRGAIKAKATNTKNKPFVVPAAYRPAFKTWLPVDMCNSTNGRLIIKPNGVTLLQEQDGALTNADCFTSLDGVSFVQSSAVTPLTLINGWTESDFATANAAVTTVKGVVHFQGAVEANLGSGPTSAEPFVLPPSFRPSRPVFVAVDMCEADNGRLEIATSGAVSVQEEDQGTTDENCFTSLDGASFVLQPKNSTALTLTNGWTGQAFGTAAAAVQLSKGVVRFQGGIEGGSASLISTLPLSMRPTKNVFVKVDLCSAAADGRLDITPDGSVSVEQEPGGLGTSAQCFTSLDGASFLK